MEYVFFQAGDTILIHAVKGGYVDIVRALLNRYADLDVEGQVSEHVQGNDNWYQKTSLSFD